MYRRKALKSISLLLGFSVSGFVVLNQSCNNIEHNDNVISDDEDLSEIISEIANIIIPDSEIPGARAAQVGSFILMMIDDCYPENIQKRFSAGVLNMNALSQEKFGKKFLKLSGDKKKIIVEGDVNEEKRLKDITKNNLPRTVRPQFFELFLNLGLLGYFTSEIGCTEVLKYDLIPGRYDGCIEMEVGQRAWAT